MYIKHVKHFLNKEGRDYFPSYVAELNKIIKSLVPDFIHAYHGIPESQVNETHLILCFKHKSGLDAWLETSEHEDVLKKLTPFMQQDWTVEGYTLK